jgi:hypothetical protein
MHCRQATLYCWCYPIYRLIVLIERPRALVVAVTFCPSMDRVEWGSSWMWLFYHIRGEHTHARPSFFIIFFPISKSHYHTTPTHIRSPPVRHTSPCDIGKPYSKFQNSLAHIWRPQADDIIDRFVFFNLTGIFNLFKYYWDHQFSNTSKMFILKEYNLKYISMPSV